MTGHADGHWTVDRIGDLEHAFDRYAPKLCIIDPVTSHLGNSDMFRDNQVRALLAPLGALAKDRDCAVVLVMHLRKSEGEAVSRVMGATAFTALPRSVVLVAKSRTNEGELVLAQMKSNLCKAPPSLRFTLGERGDVSAVRWLGRSDESADDLADVSTGRESSTRLQEASEFLVDALANGPVAATELLASAQLNNISKRTLDRASKDLSVQTSKGTDGKWYRSLPGAGGRTLQDRQDCQTDQPGELGNVGNLASAASTTSEQF